ncbi:MAG: Hpt domain-containing protein, partial [Planctomycetota bacterium]
MEELDRYIRIFRDEALEHLDTLRGGLLRLEEAGPDPEEVTPMILRCAHTLKGSARMVGLAEIGNLSHKIEDVLKGVEKNRIIVSPNLVSLLLEATDAIRDAVEAAARKEPSPEDLTDLIQRVESASLSEVQDPAPEVKTEEKPKSKEKLLSALEGLFSDGEDEPTGGAAGEPREKKPAP